MPKYDVYKFAIKNLDLVLDSIINLQKDMIAEYQSNIDAIKSDASLSEADRKNKIDEYMKSIEVVHGKIKDSNGVINNINKQIDVLKANLDVIISESNKTTEDNKTDNENATNTETVSNNLKCVVENHCKRIYSIMEEAKELLSECNNSRLEDTAILEIECQKLCKLSKTVKEMLDGIAFNANSKEKDDIKSKINSYVEFEIERANYISEEASKILKSDKNEVISSNELEVFCELIRDEYRIIKSKVQEMTELGNELKASNASKSLILAVSLLQEIIEEEVRRVKSSLTKLEKIVSPIDEEVEDEIKLDKISSTLLELNRGNYTPKELVRELKNLYDMELRKESELIIVEKKNEVSRDEKEKDTEEYKKYCAVLNKSFWTARSKASSEGIKYPSAAYERAVKEYQNDYLLTTYNVSLEEVESTIEEYKEKYKEDIYMDDVYEKALLQLRDESSKSVQELCDEKYGLSMLDIRARLILDGDLKDIIRKITIAKREVNPDDSLALSEYKKSLKLSKLLSQKEIIEIAIGRINKRAKRIEAENK